MKLKLSDAMELTRVLGELKPASITTCVLGRATVVAGAEVPSYEAIDTYWPWVKTHSVLVPCSCELLRKVHGSPVPVIIHLFDVHVMAQGDWTMDQLVDFVRSVEPPEPLQEERAVEKAVERMRINDFEFSDGTRG